MGEPQHNLVVGSSEPRALQAIETECCTIKGLVLFQGVEKQVLLHYGIDEYGISFPWYSIQAFFLCKFPYRLEHCMSLVQ